MPTRHQHGPTRTVPAATHGSPRTQHGFNTDCYGPTRCQHVVNTDDHGPTRTNNCLPDIHGSTRTLQDHHGATTDDHGSNTAATRTTQDNPGPDDRPRPTRTNTTVFDLQKLSRSLPGPTRTITDEQGPSRTIQDQDGANTAQNTDQHGWGPGWSVLVRGLYGTVALKKWGGSGRSGIFVQSGDVRGWSVVVRGDP